MSLVGVPGFICRWQGSGHAAAAAKEGSGAQWGICRRQKRPEFVSAKRAASALQARAATIERTVSNPVFSVLELLPRYPLRAQVKDLDSSSALTPGSIGFPALPGFLSLADSPVFFGLQLAGLQLVAKALFRRCQKAASGFFLIGKLLRYIDMQTVAESAYHLQG